MECRKGWAGKAQDSRQGGFARARGTPYLGHLAAFDAAFPPFLSSSGRLKADEGSVQARDARRYPNGTILLQLLEGLGGCHGR